MLLGVKSAPQKDDCSISSTFSDCDGHACFKISFGDSVPDVDETEFALCVAGTNETGMERKIRATERSEQPLIYISVNDKAGLCILSV